VVLACTELGALRASCSNALQPATTHCNALHHPATEVGGDGGEDGGGGGGGEGGGWGDVRVFDTTRLHADAAVFFIRANL